MSLDRMEHTGFSSGEARGRMGVPRYIGGAMGSAARRQAGRVRRTGSGQARAGGMLVKAGLCGVVCAGVLLLRWAEGGGAIFPEGAVAAVSAQAAQEAQEESLSQDPDRLGRLQFVSLPSIIQVFSSTAGPTLGLTYTSASLDPDSLLASLTLETPQTVSVAGACKVKELGEDPDMGSYVRLVLDGKDQEVYYLGLSEISVEVGQSLKVGDTLGKGEATLHLAVYEAGRPTDPLAFFGLEKAKV